jgi:hypothetical protein
MKYEPKGFQSVTEARATIDWLLTHSLKHIIWNWFKAHYYFHQGKYDVVEG